MIPNSLDRVREVRSLNELMQKHLDWRVWFRTAIRKHEELDVAAIRLDCICQMGIWLHLEGDRWGDLATDLRHKHTAFHLAAAQVAAVSNDGDYYLAEQMVGPGSEFMRASSAVRTAIFDLVASSRRAQPIAKEA